MKRVLQLFLITILCIIAFPMLTSADTGPKPSLTIIVKGMGDEQYYLDLLVSGEAKYMWLKLSDEERKKASKLAEYNKDGLHAALLKGTAIPMYGSIVGVKQADGSYIHKFSYMGVPTEFKIAILKSDGTLIISNTMNRTEFQAVMEYNVSERTIWEMPSKKNYIFGFFLRLAATLIIEIGIAILFGFSLKKYWKTLVITNVLTQSILNIIIIVAPIISGKASVTMPYIFGEILTVIIELAVYCKYLTQHSLKRRIIYTVSANVLSLLIGFSLLFLP
jgi:hypothetical protein